MGIKSRLLLFVFAFAEAFEDGESGFLGVADRERLGLNRRIERGDDLANGAFASGAGGQFGCADRAPQRELSTADDAVAIANLIFVKRHTESIQRRLQLTTPCNQFSTRPLPEQNQRQQMNR